MERDAGELFNVCVSTIKPDDWINISAIVELEVLGEQAKNFFVLMVCHYILEILRVNPSGGVDSRGNLMPVRHVIFIEEAHNIIAQSTQQASSDSIDPKISATAYIVKMLAEVRALREAIIIADQLPTALTSEVTKNTGLKLVHRLTAQDDREQIGTAISASALQLERMASFTSGSAFIYYERTMKPFELQIAEWLKPEISFDVSNDTQLYSEIWRMPTIEHTVLVAFRNWQDKYLFTVDDELSKLEKRYIEAKVTDMVEIQCCLSGKKILLAECMSLMKKCYRLQKLWLMDRDSGCPLNNEFDDIITYIQGMVSRLNSIRGII